MDGELPSGIDKDLQRISPALSEQDPMTETRKVDSWREALSNGVRQSHHQLVSEGRDVESRQAKDIIWKKTSDNLFARAEALKAEGNIDELDDVLTQYFFIAQFRELEYENLDKYTRGNPPANEAVLDLVAKGMSQDVFRVLNKNGHLIATEDSWQNEIGTETKKVHKFTNRISQSVSAAGFASGYHYNDETFEISDEVMPEDQWMNQLQQMNISSHAIIAAGIAHETPFDNDRKERVVTNLTHRALQTLGNPDIGVTAEDVEKNLLLLAETNPRILTDDEYRSDWSAIQNRRVVNSHYRNNSSSNMELDMTIVSLWKNGHQDIAKKLLTAASDEMTVQLFDNEGQLGAIGHALNILKNEDVLTPGGADRIRNGIAAECRARRAAADERLQEITAKWPALKRFVVGDTQSLLKSFNNPEYVLDTLDSLHEYGEENIMGVIQERLPNIPHERIQPYLSSLVEGMRYISEDEAVWSDQIKRRAIIGHMSRFQDPSHAVRGAKSFFGERYADYLQEFEEVPMSIAIEHIRSAEGYIPEIFGMGPASIAARLIRQGPDKQDGSDTEHKVSLWNGIQEKIAHELIDTGNEDSLSSTLRSFSNLPSDIAITLVDKGHAGSLPTALQAFPEIDRQQLAEYIISGGHYVDATHFALAFGTKNIPPQAFEKALATNADFKMVLERYNQFSSDRIPSLDRTVSIFGDFASRDLHRFIADISAGIIAPEMRELGVTEAGTPGIDHLQARVRKMLPELISVPEVHADQILANPVVQALFKKAIRYDDSSFGKHNQGEFESIIRNNRHNAEQPLQYEKSNIVDIATVEGKKKELEKPTFEKDATDRYKRVVGQLRGAVELLERDKPFSTGLAELQSMLDTSIDAKMRAVDALKTKNAGKAEELQTEIDNLKGLNIRSLKDFEQNFLTLSGDKKLHDKMSSIMFAAALRMPPEGFNKATYENRRNQILSMGEGDNPDIDSMSFVADTIDHVINQEVYGHYFESKEARNAFAKMTDVSSLQNSLSKAQGGLEKTGSVPIRFEPTRGLLMEFSGHIADACWAEKYPSIAKAYPNMTAVTIRQHPDETAHDGLVGAFMMIEAEAADGGPPLLIIRGLNPRENFVNKADVGDLYDKTADYVKALAEKSGRRGAIVIDTHSGGSGTNRPVLHGYMSSEAQSMKTVTPVGNTVFNGYDIDNKTYLLDKPLPAAA